MGASAELRCMSSLGADQPHPLKRSFMPRNTLELLQHDECEPRATLTCRSPQHPSRHKERKNLTCMLQPSLPVFVWEPFITLEIMTR